MECEIGFADGVIEHIEKSAEQIRVIVNAWNDRKIEIIFDEVIGFKQWFRGGTDIIPPSEGGGAGSIPAGTAIAWFPVVLIHEDQQSGPSTQLNILTQFWRYRSGAISLKMSLGHAASGEVVIDITKKFLQCRMARMLL